MGFFCVAFKNSLINKDLCCQSEINRLNIKVTFTKSAGPKCVQILNFQIVMFITKNKLIS